MLFLIFTVESEVFYLVIRENDEVKTILDYGVEVRMLVERWFLLLQVSL